jgi:hypothetical protein
VASAWGTSWGTSWGNSWGDTGTVAVVVEQQTGAGNLDWLKRKKGKVRKWSDPEPERIEEMAIALSEKSFPIEEEDFDDDELLIKALTITLQ